MRSSIGHFNVSIEDCDPFHSLSVTNITNIESNIEGILGPDHVQGILSAVYAAEANIPSGINSHIYLSYVSCMKIYPKAQLI